MADYSINLGVKLSTKDIDTQISNYNKKQNLIKVKADFDISDITSKLNAYKAKQISVDSKLNTDGITDAIRKYQPPKKIHLESDLSTANITKKINDYVAKKPIRVDVELTKSSINQQIKDANPTQQITIKSKLDDNAISEAINSYQASKPIRIKVKPDFSELNFDKVEDLLKDYTARTPLKVNISLSKTEINKQISEYNNSLQSENGRKVLLGVKLTDNAVNSAITDYKTKNADKLKIPIDLIFSGEAGFDDTLKKALSAYKKVPLEIPARLKPSDKSFSSQLQKTPISIDVTLKNPKAINDEIATYTNKVVPINASLVPAKNFDSAVTKKPVKVHATLIPEEINDIINHFTPSSKVLVNVELNKTDINSQVKALPKITEPLRIGVELTPESINNAIANSKTSSPLKVGIDLQESDINAQIEKIHPTSSIKVRLDLDDGVNEEIKKQSGQNPIEVNVKLDRKDINEQIRNFKTDTKIKVGVKLDFASHKDSDGKEIQKGIAKQIKDYTTKSKVKIGVQLDPSNVEEQVSNISTVTPIRLRVELDPNGIQNVQNQIINLRQQLQDLSRELRDNEDDNRRRNHNGDVTRAYRELISLQDRISNKQKQIAKLDTSENSREILNLSNQVDDLFERYQRLRALFDGRFSNAQLDRLNRGFEIASENLSIINSKAVDARAELARGIGVKLETGDFDRQIARIENGIGGLTSVSVDVQRELNNVRDAFNAMEIAYANDDTEALIAANERFAESLRAVKNQLDINKMSSARDKHALGILGGLIDYDYDNQVDKINRDFNNLSEQSDDAKVAVTQLNQALADMGSAANRGDIDGLIRAHERYNEYLKAARNQIAMQQRSEKEHAAAYKDEADELQAIADRIDKIKIKIANLGKKPFSSNEISGLTVELQELEAAYQELYARLHGNLSSSQLSAITEGAFTTEKALEQVENQIKDIKAALANKINLKIADDTFKSQISDAAGKIAKLKDETGTLRPLMIELDAAFDRMTAAVLKGDDGIDELIESYQDYEIILKKIKNQTDINSKAEKDKADANKLTNDIALFQAKIDAWLTKNSAAAGEFGEQLRQLKVQAENCDRVTLDNLETEFKRIDKEAEAAGKKTKTFTDSLRAQFEKYRSYFSIASVFMYAEQAMRSMFEQVKLIDSAMTELKKVTDETDESYNQFLNNAASRSKELGTTIDGLISSTADFARLGYGFKDSQGLAEAANIYAVVGDEIEGVEDATQSLVSTMAAFREEMDGVSNSDFAMSIVDKMNEVSNNYAISSGGIGEALQRSASSMAAANNTLDETIAMITAANEVAQNPEKVGNAMKTMSMRIRGAKTELEEAGESTEGMAESTASLRAEIKALSGVDIMLNESTFKSTYQIMDELSKKWKDLTDIQQATIIELVAGKHQGNVFSSLMANFDTARKALDTSLNSSGSAMAEHAKWSESLEARLNKLKAAWQSLSQTFMNSDFLKVSLDFLTGLMDVIDKLIDKVGVFPTLVGGWTVFSSVFDKNSVFNNMFKVLNTDLDGFTNKIGFANKSLAELISTFNFGRTGAGGFKDFFRGIKSVGNGKLSKSDLSSLQAYNDLIDQCVGSQTAWNRTMQSASPAAQNLVAAANGGKVAMSGLTVATNTSRLATIGMTVATMALNAALTMGISAVISLVISKLDDWIETSDELSKRIDDVTSKYNEQHNALMKLKGDYDTSDEDSMISKYGELSKGVNDLGENISLTADEYEEYRNIVSTIAEQNPDLITGYNSQGDAILSCAGSVDKLAEAYKNLIREQNKEVLDNGADVFEDFQNKLKNSSMYHTTTVASDKYNTGYEIKTHYDTNHLKQLEALMNMNDKELEEFFNNAQIDKVGNSEYSRISNLLSSYGIERNVGTFSSETYQEHIIRAIKEGRNEIKKVLNEASSDLNAYADDMGSLTNAYFSNAFLDDYSHLSERIQGVINQVSSSFDAEFYAQFFDEEKYKTQEERYNALTDYYNSILSAFDGLSDSQSSDLEAVFDLKTQFNGGEISYGEYVNSLREANNLIDSLGLDDDIESHVKLGLNTEEVIGDYEALANRIGEIYAKDDKANLMSMPHFSGASEAMKAIAEKATNEAKKFLNNLTASEYSVVVDLIQDGVDLSNFDIDSLRTYIEKEVAIKDALNFKMNISVEKEGIEAVNTAITESVSACGLSVEALNNLQSRYSELDSYDPAKLFERTSQGIHVNRDELNRLEKEMANSKLNEIDQDLEIVTKAYEDVTEEIRTCSDATKRNALLAEQTSYANKIKELSEYQAHYEGLTSAYNNWINAQSAGEEGDIYDDVMEKLEAAKELREQGLVGTNEFAAAVGFMSGKDTTAMSIDEIVAAYDEALPKMNRYFTEGSKGAQNLLNDINGINKEWAHIDEQSGEWKINVPIEKAAEELGISADALEAVLGKGTDYGLTINYDSVYKASESLETLYTKAESANDRLRELGKTNLTFSFESTNVKDLETQIEKAQKIVDEFKKSDLADDGKINLSVEGAEDAQLVLETLMLQKQEVAKPEIMKVSLAMIGDEKLGNVISAMQEIQSYKNLYDIQIAIGADTSETETKIQEVIGKISTLKNENPEVFADLKLDTEGFNSALNTLSGNINAGVQLDPTALETVQTALSSVDATVLANVGIGDTKAVDEYSADKDAKMKYLVDDTEVKLWTAPEKEGKLVYSPIVLDLLDSQLNKTGTITYNAKINGISDVNGTANVNGTAFANGTVGRAFKQGSWSTKDSGTALVGELGMETLVRDGRFYTIGDSGAEFIKYRKGDIIFNHLQTKELFEHGKVTSGNGRGRTFANGTAFANGKQITASGYGGLYSPIQKKEEEKKSKKELEDIEDLLESKAAKIAARADNNTGNTATGGGDLYNGDSGNSTSSSSSSKTEKEFKEKFDWIELAIDRVERAIDRLDLKANSVYKNWSERNGALTDEISKVGDEINLQQSAYDRYIKEANSVGLSEAYAEKVRNGTIDISSFKGEGDEALVEKIKEYQQWYEKALDCKDAVDELKEKEAELYKQRFDNVSAQYEGILAVVEHEKSMLEEYISQSEAQAWLVSSKYYEALASNERENIAELKNQKNTMLAEMQNAMNSGTIAEGSEAWYEMVNAVDEVTLAITEGETALKEYAQTIQQLKWEYFDILQDKISAITDETDFLIELLSSDKLYDDNGQLTNSGSATMGQHGVAYNTYMYQAEQAAKEAERLKKELAEDPYDTELEERYREMLALQREYILNAQDEKEAIRDMVEEGINLEIEALEERIDKYNEALESEKDLYDYQRKVEEQTKNIASLRKQIDSYDGDDSEETKAVVQKLKLELSNAEADLQETEYEKYISDTQQMLDNLVLEYEETLNMRLDNIDALISDMIVEINSDASIIGDTIHEKADSVGYTLTDSMNNIWSGANNVITNYSEKFLSSNTTTNNTLNTINNNLQSIITKMNADAAKKASSASTSSSSSSNKSSSSSSSSTSSSKSSSSSAPSASSNTLKGVAAAIWVYGGSGSGWGHNPERKQKLTEKFGSSGADKVQDYINRYGSSGELYNLWVSNGKNLDGYKYNAFKSGVKNLGSSQFAWTQENGSEFIIRPSDGAILTPLAKADSVLNASASNNIWDMANSPAEFIKDNLKLGTLNPPNNSNTHNNYTQNLDNVVFSFPNVQNYEQLLSAMQKDKNFERLILSMSIDRLAGKSSLGKNKSIR